MKKAPDPIFGIRSFCDGAGGRGRTGTVSLPRDFESRTSANSITPACLSYSSILSQVEGLNQGYREIMGKFVGSSDRLHAGRKEWYSRLIGIVLEGWIIMREILRECIRIGKEETKFGKVAEYIPELEKGNKEDVGIAIMDLEGICHGEGEYLKNFTLQSITKVTALLLALEDKGKEEIFRHVHMEPTGDPFNSIMSFEVKNPEKPFNPMINAGAMVVTSLIAGRDKEEKMKRILAFSDILTGHPGTTYDERVYHSEKETGHRNRSLAYFMKSTGIMQGSPEEILDLYFMQCSILGNCRDIATIGAILASNGIHPVTRQRVVRKENARIVKTVMTTCGMYDASGEFAVSCGIPAKSGVGGGILGAVPGAFGVGVFGPSLDKKGNSIAGIKMLEYLSRELDLSIF